METEKKTEKGSRTEPTEEELSALPLQGVMGVGGIIVVSAIVFTSLRMRMPILESPHDRLLFTIRWLFLSACTIFFMVMDVGRIRGQTAAINPLTGHEHFVEVANNILRNTVEQFLLHAIGLVTLSTYLREDRMIAVPLLVSLFVIGRLVYWWGYSRKAMWRGPGMVMTFFPTMGVYLFCACCFWLHGIDFKE